MKYFFSLLGALLLLVWLPTVVKAQVLDCASNPNAHTCACVVPDPNGGTSTNVTQTPATESACSNACQNMSAATYNFTYCSNGSEVSTGPKNISSSTGSYCAANPTGHQCICFGEGIEYTNGSLKDDVASSDEECLEDCTGLRATAYEFDQCSPSGVATGGKKPIVPPEEVCADYTCFCQTGLAPEPAKLTATSAPECQSQCQVLSGTVVTSQCNSAQPIAPTPKRNPIIPNLNVQIPGLDFSKSIYQDSNSGLVTSNFLGLYIQAAYRFLLPAMALIAVVMLMIGGLEYTISGGSAKRLEKAKTRIKNAIIGLILLFAAYDLAFLLNPNTVVFQSLSVPMVAGVTFLPPEGETEIEGEGNSSLTGTGVKVANADHIINWTGDDAVLDPEVFEAFKKAAQLYYERTGKNVILNSASRTLETQVKLWYGECIQNGGGVCGKSVCDVTWANSNVLSKNKSTGRYTFVGELAGVTDSATIISKLMQYGRIDHCPHTSQVAVDIWAEGYGGNYQVNVKDQEALITAMIDSGFCRLSTEIWHFELNSMKVSRKACQTTWNSRTYIAKTSGKTTTPPDTCQKWDFYKHVCVTDNPR